jgi:serine protease Do
MRHLPLLLALLATPAFAQQMVYYKISSGTGFVVNNDGHVVTNEHVVRGCQSISILTPKGEEQATLLATNPERDLAVLKTAYIAKKIASFGAQAEPVEINDKLIMMGFHNHPTNGLTGYFFKTRVISLTSPEGDHNWIQLSQGSLKGNSGGPVLNKYGKVVAVTSRIAEQVPDNNIVSKEPINRTDVAITLAALQDFLRGHGVSFYESASGLVAYGDGALQDNAKNFIVPVRCIQGVEHSG